MANNSDYIGATKLVKQWPLELLAWPAAADDNNPVTILLEQRGGPLRAAKRLISSRAAAHPGHRQL